ncbi:WW domain-binding protein 4 [Drosophila guanche]|uniref:Blast:WW domain-binding protein 4 n=1 Tax=Drosophila guanche TaxID=7266 RepID=A0A3B0JFW1_DROGU|nr:WW domain-binding protein 4 [Drosophila guanche]SPP79122.1 blast:WW domain-binding protein 4 [Drosophila guanche]
MTEFWKSNERKYCDFCKCWLSDNKASIAFHEDGKRHKLNVAKRITDISRSSEKSERERLKMDADIRKMEEAAMKSYAQDIHGRADMTARSINTVMSAVAASGSSGSRGGANAPGRGRQVDPMRLEGYSDEEEDNRRVTVSKVGADPVVPDASLWVEGKSDEGHTYYWNVKTNESVWKPPKEGYLSYEEYERINQLAIDQQEISQEKESLRFRANADEEVARVNRERLKAFRKPETAKEKKQKEEKRLEFKTEEEAATKEIGQWQTVEVKAPEEPIDWELPQTDYYIPPPVVSTNSEPEPPVKRFKEKTISGLDGEAAASVPSTFKKRKFANKGNARKRLDD